MKLTLDSAVSSVCLSIPVLLALVLFSPFTAGRVSIARTPCPDRPNRRRPENPDTANRHPSASRTRPAVVLKSTSIGVTVACVGLAKKLHGSSASEKRRIPPARRRTKQEIAYF